MSKYMSKTVKGAAAAVKTLTDAALSHEDASQAKALGRTVKLFKLALEARKAGLTAAEFYEFINVTRSESQIVTSVDIELSGAISSSLEQADGSEFSVSFKGGGTVFGFGVEAGASYLRGSSRASSERSNENFSITVRAARYPDSEDHVKAVTAWAYRVNPVDVPDLPDGLDAGALIERLLPLIKGIDVE